MENQHKEAVEAQMRIRKPVSEVFNAFIDPSITCNFWFTKSTGKLESGKSVIWQWDMYNLSIKVHVKQIIPARNILIDWGEPATKVEFNFEDLGDDSTYVIIRHYGFTQTGADLIAILKDSTGGFTTVLDGLKAFLEHGIQLNLIEDKFWKKALK